MKLELKFRENTEKLNLKFGQIQRLTDDGYEQGYQKGLADGLNQRQYEVWTFTLTDGTVVEKEVPLL